MNADELQRLKDEIAEHELEKRREEARAAGEEAARKAEEASWAKGYFKK